MHLVFDILILLFILGGLLPIYLFWFSASTENLSLSKSTKLILTVIALFWAGTITWGSFIEPRIITTAYYDLDIFNNNSESQPIKMAIIADLHLGPYVKGNTIQTINEKIENIKPDLIVMPGDFIFHKEKNAEYLKDLEVITKKYPTYAIWGNHDFNAGSNNKNEAYLIDRTAYAQQIFDTIGVKSINNQAHKLIHNEKEFWLLGIDEIWANRADYSQAFNNITANNNAPRILMVHNPDAILDIEKQNKKIDLLIAGHTHGGQIRLPLIGPVPQLPTILGREYDQGELFYNDYRLFITSGIGMMGPRARLFNPPEISVLNLR